MVTGLTATTAVRVTTCMRAVRKSAGAFSVNAPLEFAVAVAIWVHAPVNGKSTFSSATGVEPTPLTVPVTVRPVPQVGLVVEGVIATPVGALPVVKERLRCG